MVCLFKCFCCLDVCFRVKGCLRGWLIAMNVFEFVLLFARVFERIVVVAELCRFA